MTRPPTGWGAPDFDPARERVRLFRQLEANDGRWGLVVLVHRELQPPGDVADELERRWCGTRRVFADAVAHPDWMSLEDRLAATAADGARAIQLLGFERWLLDIRGDWVRKLVQLNFRREGFADRVTVPVLLWLRPDVIRRLSLKAVDLWSWRAGLFHLVDD